MNYQQTKEQMSALHAQIQEIRGQLRILQENVEPQPVENYEFKTVDGTVRLLDLFGEKTDLFVIHNMGVSCSYCTLWADGYNGVYPHLADRAAFIVTSPDAPLTQRRFAENRNWQFPMVSHQGCEFAKAMGYGDPETGWLPGLSVFQREGGTTVRVSDQNWGPGDDFCNVWHFLALLPQGSNGWQPKFSYGQK